MERLTAQDRMSLPPDELGWPEDIGALGLLDGTRLLDADERLDIDAVRESIGRHLPRVPRFRHVLHIPRWGLGGPLRIDTPAFHLEDHVRLVAVPAPAGEAQLLATVDSRRARPFDRSRPAAA
jgi:hypothetical protein